MSERVLSTDEREALALAVEKALYSEADERGPEYRAADNILALGFHRTPTPTGDEAIAAFVLAGPFVDDETDHCLTCGAREIDHDPDVGLHDPDCLWVQAVQSLSSPQLQAQAEVAALEAVAAWIHSDRGEEMCHHDGTEAPDCMLAAEDLLSGITPPTEPTEATVERVAEALADFVGRTWSAMPEYERDIYRNQARAAIAATKALKERSEDYG